MILLYPALLRVLHVPVPILGFSRPAYVVGKNHSYPEIVPSSQANYASVASLSWVRDHLLFYLFLIYNLFKLDCLGNLPNLIIGITPPPFPLSDIAPTLGVKEADVGAGEELQSLS